jgi:hypothetical protein
VDTSVLRGLLIRLNGAGYRELRQLALDEDTTLQSLANKEALVERQLALDEDTTTLQSLAIEALNDLLKKRGAKPIVANRLREAD